MTKIASQFRKTHWRQTLLFSLSAAFFVSLTVPLQTYLGNKDLFACSTAEVLAEAVPFAILSALALFTFLEISELRFGRLFHVIAAGLLLCAYLETGPLSYNLPPLDGVMDAFRDPVRRIVDTSILISAFIVAIVLFKWTKRYFHLVGAFILIMGCATLFDVAGVQHETPTSACGELFSKGMCERADVVESTRFSPSRNVIILVLDSVPGQMAAESALEELALQNSFPGFVAFTNNLAMHEITQRGIPGIMTGTYLDMDTSPNQYASSIFSENSLLYPYTKDGCPVFFGAGVVRDFTNRKLGDFSGIEKISSSGESGLAFLRNSKSTPFISLLDVVRFRLAPYRVKWGLLGRAQQRATAGTAKKDYGYEPNLFAALGNAPVSKEQKTALAIFHTEGLHIPITRDRDGKKLPSPTYDLRAHREYCLFLLRETAKFMERLQEKGVYDNSLIIICADHGPHTFRNMRKADGSEGHGQADSILWIKPAGSRSPFSFSDAPASNSKISAVAKMQKDRDLSKEEIVKTIACEKRIFRAKFGAGRLGMRNNYLYEWIYDEKGRPVSCKNLGFFSSL